MDNVPDDLRERVGLGDEIGKAGRGVSRGAGDEVGGDVDHDDAALALDEVQDVVWDVAGVRAEGFCAAVGEDWGRETAGPGRVRGSAEDVAHG